MTAQKFGTSVVSVHLCGCFFVHSVGYGRSEAPIEENLFETRTV